jgi:capsular polysaccharide biosynthesis protein
MEWLDETTTGCPRTLEPSTTVLSYGPATTSTPVIAPVVLPKVEIRKFDCGCVSAASSSIWIADRLLVERVEGVDSSTCDYAAGHIVLHGQSRAIVAGWPTEELDRGVFLAGNGCANYYHWMLEMLPKLEYLSDSSSVEGDFPLLVSAEVFRIPTFLEALRQIAPGRPFVPLDGFRIYRVGQLVHISGLATLAFNLREGYEARVSDHRPRASAIRFLRDRLGVDAGEGKAGPRRRLFLARQTVRRNYNQDEIFDVFEPHGFVRVQPEKLTLREQIDLVGNAEMIAGPTGAAWTNLVFCRGGTRCLCWMAEESGEFSAFSNLAQIVGADLRYVTYWTGTRSTVERYAREYRVDAEEVRRALNEMLAGASAADTQHVV